MNFILFLWFSPSGFIYPYLSSFLSRFSIFVYPRLHVHYSLNTFIFLSPSLYMCISYPNLSRYYSLLSSSFLLYLFLSLSLSFSFSLFPSLYFIQYIISLTESLFLYTFHMAANLCTYSLSRYSTPHFLAFSSRLLGIAMDTPKGLLVPVIKQVQLKVR